MIKRNFKLFSMFFLVVTISTAQINVACVGNSITEGWHGNPSYVPTLKKLLGKDYVIGNYGKSGATVFKKGDVPYWKQGAYSKALKSNADIITIMLGANDAKSKNWDKLKSEFKSDYAALIDALQSANKNAKIFPVLPTPACKDNYGIKNSNIKSEIPIIKDIANEKGLSIIDANTPLLSLCSHFADGVHPKQAGADTIAHVLSRSILGATYSMINVSRSSDKREAKGVYSVFNGNISFIFADLIPSIQYELSVFSVNGVLIEKTVVNASFSSQSRVKRMFAQTNTVRLFTVKKVID